jgi:hypothetical protein
MNKYLNGSSETLRKVTFNFTKFNKFYLPEHKKKIDQSFLEWFVGFAEGDGSFIVSNTKNGKKRLFFILVQKDEQALHKLRSSIGFGKIQKHQNSHRYAVSSSKDIDRLINLFNGNLLLNKTNERFRLWVNARNESKLNQPQIKIQGQLKDVEYLKNSWLSGFIAAEGCFNVRHSFSKAQRSFDEYRLKFRFILDQKNEEEILKSIQKSIGSGFVYSRKKNDSQFRYTVQHRDYILLIINYLKRCPLRVKKNVDVVRMQKLINYSKSRKIQPWVGKILKRVKTLLFRLAKS